MFIVDGSFLSTAATSKPFISGIITSSTIRSGRSARTCGDGLAAVGGDADLVAGLGELLGEQLADVGLVVDDEDARLCGRRSAAW